MTKQQREAEMRALILSEHKKRRGIASGVWDCASVEKRLDWLKSVLPNESEIDLRKLANLRWYQAKEADRATFKKAVDANEKTD